MCRARSVITNTVYAATVLGALEHAVLAVYHTHLEHFWLICWVAVMSSYSIIAFVSIYDTCLIDVDRRTRGKWVGLFGVVVSILMTTTLVSAGFGWRNAWACLLMSYFAAAIGTLIAEYARLYRWRLCYREVVGGGAGV
jgi:hypothetical protein